MRLSRFLRHGKIIFVGLWFFAIVGWFSTNFLNMKLFDTVSQTVSNLKPTTFKVPRTDNTPLSTAYFAEAHDDDPNEAIDWHDYKQIGKDKLRHGPGKCSASHSTL